MSGTPPLVLCGAFDRHNFGDILLAHIAALECGRPVLHAGLAARDLRPWGGPAVAALDAVVAGWHARYGDAPLELIHVGGEILDCDLWQAAVMLGTDDGARAAIARYEGDAVGARRWAAVQLGTTRAAPYVVAKSALPGGHTVFRTVGGVGLAERDPDFRAEVLEALRQADALSVRERTTQAWLAGAGIAATLEPDPVVRIAELFGQHIVPPAALAQQPYVALQFAAECGDDATLADLARGAARLARHHDAGLVLFRAGAAPWHDALEPYRRLAAHIDMPVHVFESLDVWDICGLIAGARACAATSLHARIVAAAFGVPVVSLERAPGAGRKLRAYLDTWEPQATVLAPAQFAAAF